MSGIAHTTQHDDGETEAGRLGSTRFVARWFVLGLVRKLGKSRSDFA